MNRSTALVFVLSLATVALSHAATETASKDLTVTSLERSLDIASQLIKANIRIQIQNSGSTPAKHVHYTLDPAFEGHVTHFSAAVSYPLTYLNVIVKYLSRYRSANRTKSTCELSWLT